MKLKRPLRGSETGADVRMVQRALNNWTGGVDIPVNGRFDFRTKDRLMAFQAERSVRPASGYFGQKSLDALWPFFDAYGKWGYRRFKPQTRQEITFAKLVSAMQQMDAATPGYRLGGEHGIPLEDVDIHNATDCSSSCSWVLWKAGLFDGVGAEHIAAVSGQLESWGEPGPGKFFTLYANGEHVWIRLHKSKWWRFDTSPHGDGGRGPQLRFLPRFSSTFVARHAKGL